MDYFEQMYNMTFHEDKPINEPEFMSEYEIINKNNVNNIYFFAEFENQISQKLKRISSMYILRPKSETNKKSPKSKSTKIIKRKKKYKI